MNASAPELKSTLSFLGIECGGTRSVALFWPGSDKKPFRMEAGPANLHLLNQTQLVKLFRHFSTIHQGCPHPHGLAIGMPGTRTETHRECIRQAAARVWPATPCYATNDLETALAAADPSPLPVAAQILVLSGTGSCCFGRAASGKTFRFGGWGHILGDKGSGYQIGHDALKTVIQRYDLSGQWPDLGQLILHTLTLTQPDDLIGWAVNADKSAVAALTEIVFQAWKNKDAIARQIITQAARSLASDAGNCASRLVNSPSHSVQFIFAGSILTKQPDFAALVETHLQKIWPKCRVSRLQREGAWGALALAQKHFSPQSSPKTRPALRSSSHPRQ